MIVRALDTAKDWQFGRGKNDYLKNRDAIKQIIGTRLYQFLGDCFFAVSEGIDWFNFLGSKDDTGLQLAINSVILNTEGVTGLVLINTGYDSSTRNFRVEYTVQTIYGAASDSFLFDPTVVV